MYENKKLAKMMYTTCKNETVGRMDGGEEMAGDNIYFMCRQNVG